MNEVCQAAYHGKQELTVNAVPFRFVGTTLHSVLYQTSDEQGVLLPVVRIRSFMHQLLQV